MSKGLILNKENCLKEIIEARDKLKKNVRQVGLAQAFLNNNESVLCLEKLGCKYRVEGPYLVITEEGNQNTKQSHKESE